MHSLGALKRSLKEGESKKKKRRKGSGEGDRGVSGSVDHAEDETLGGEDHKAEMERVGLVDGSQQEAAAVVHAQKNKRKGLPSPRAGGGANDRKKVKNATKAEEKKKMKNGKEADARDEGPEGSFSGSGPNRESYGRGLRAMRWSEENEVSGSNGSISLAGIGVSHDVPKVDIVVSPHMPRRYGYLLKLLTFLLPCESRGRAYERPLHRIETFLRQKGCGLCLFFEWKPREKQTLCWMFNTSTRTHVQFLVNPAFTSEVLDVKVQHAACSFSSNFGGNEAWDAVKEMLEMMFCLPQHEPSEEPDHLFIFTRIDDCVYFRNMKIVKIPSSAGGNDDALVLREVGPYLCLKLVDVQRESAALCRVSDDSRSQITTETSLCPTKCYSMSPGFGSCMFHSISLNGKTYLIVLENGLDLSVFEDYSVSLLEFLEEEPFLKTKKIVGSKDYEEYNFVRNIGKLIIRSIFSQLEELFCSAKCVKNIEELSYKNILLKGSSVRFFGVKLVKLEEDLATKNVHHVVRLMGGCFSQKLIPCDVRDLFYHLSNGTFENLKLVKDDPSLLLAKERRELLIRLHTEYKTNVKPELFSGDDYLERWNSFFSNSPYLDSWISIMERNRYLSVVANYNSVFQTMRLGKKKVEEGKEGEMGEFQLCIMRNCDVHISENAEEDGITPFRLCWTDYIRTCYFPRYLSFIHNVMVAYKPKVT